MKKIILISIGITALIAMSIFIKVELFPDTLSSRQAWSKWNTITKENTLKRNDLWKQDIDFLVKNLEEKHKNLYHSISEKEFKLEAELLKEELPNLTDVGKLIRIQSLVAKVGDGHTRVANDVPLNWFPIVLEEFDDGIYVISSSEEFEEIIGSRLVGINGINLEDIIIKLNETVSHDNKIDLRYRTLFIIRSADYLKHFNIINDIESAVFDFEKLNGETINVSLNSYYHKENPTWIGVNDKYSEIENVLYTKNINEIYWYEYFPKDKLVYFQYNRAMNNENKPVNEFIPELLGFLEKNNIEKFIFDIRNNGGGNSSIIEPLIEGLAANDRINQRGNLFVVIGKNTYSSAILNAIKLTQETNAILIGKPTGGMPNHYGEVKAFNLPNSGLRITYSTKYFQHSEMENDSIYPEIEVKYLFKDFINGIDPVMREIFRTNHLH